MNRMKAILAAGTLTGLVLVTALAFGWGRGQDGETAVEQPAPVPEIIINPVVMPAETETAAGPETQAQIEAAAAAVQSVSAQAAQPGQTAQAYEVYIQQLEAAVQVMQSREAEYQAQIEQANQTVLQLQDQLNSQIAAQAAAPAPAAAVAAPPPQPVQPAPPPVYQDDDDDEYEEYDDDDEYEEYDDDDDEYESEEYDDD